MTTDECRASYGINENVLRLIVIMVVQFYEHSRNRGVVYFRWVNCMVCELYLNKVDIKMSQEYSTENSAQCCVAAWMREEFGGE